MSITKLSKIFISFFVVLQLAACAGMPEIDLDCSPLPGDFECSTSAIFAVQGSANNFDAGKLAVDSSQSTVGFTQNTYSATIVQKRNGVIISTHDFQFSRSGHSWAPLNVQSINTWVANNVVANDTIEIGISNILVAPHSGTNIIVTELFYDDVIIAGGSNSWYTSPFESEYISIN